MYYTSTSVQGNVHEAVAFVNKFPLLASNVFQFVQQMSGVVAIVFRTGSREDMTQIRKFLNQTPLEN